MSTRPKRVSDGIVMKRVGEEMLIYDLTTNRAHCLNGAARAVWELCDGQSDVEQLAIALTAELGIAHGEGVVWLALGELQAARLVEGLEAPKSRVPRREVLARVAVMGALALPVVTTLVAPMAAAAASDGGGGGTGAEGDGCAANADCLSGLCCDTLAADPICFDPLGDPCP